ncbi:FRG domain-containing protein [Mucilaginibacter daejeonensis]|uniref:FRG domain-containing protein n=1 Tax=Mucilaginibacter daejeonensis TaxID=398049 RepID=UPI001D17BD71|nr:FRG domain-containing protein [Mucilaginibacter daejeonensis]UEG54916.1 FRG domain-containing protein [Mucilaginibacter daejeonensis]
MPNYSFQEVINIQDYAALIEKIKTNSENKGNKTDLLFRGQNSDSPLLPKLARLTLKGKITNIEKLMLEEFKRGILPLSEFQPENNWDLLALAQHHGLPTRLLDWTYSALVALWFTVSRPAKIDKNKQPLDGVVWILNADVKDFRTNTELIDPLSNKITKIFRSTVVSRRISAQSGVFTVHKINEGGKMIRFETHRTFSKKLTKVTIPAAQFAAIRKQLHIMGVNSASVFPDIDGYCRHLEWRYSKLSDELPGESK